MPPSVTPPATMTASALRGLVCLSVCTFVAITTEMLPVGLLPRMSEDLGVPESRVGLVVTVYAVLVALLSLPLTRATRRLPRKPLLIATVAGYGASNLLVALAPTFAVVVVGRTLGGVSHALFFSVVSAYAARLVPWHLVGRAVAITFAGTSLGFVLGVPAATFVGELAGWQVAFGALAGFAGLLVVLVLLVLPAVATVPPPPAPPRAPAARVEAGTAQTSTARALGRLRALRPRRRGASPLRVIGLVNVTLFLGHYALYTYISPTLVAAGLAVEHVSGALLALGAAGIIGIVAAGRLADHRPRAGLLGALGLMLLGTGGLLVAPGGVAGTLALAVVWSIGFGAVPSFFMTAGLRAGGQPDEAGAVVNATSNVGIAAGAGVGAAVLDAAGVAWLPVPAVLLIAVSIVLVAVARTAFPRRPVVVTVDVDLDAPEADVHLDSSGADLDVTVGDADVDPHVQDADVDREPGRPSGQTMASETTAPRNRTDG